LIKTDFSACSKQDKHHKMTIWFPFKAKEFSFYNYNLWHTSSKTE